MPGYWLMKSEEDEYPIAWLRKVRRTRWEGIRNYTARNFLRDQAAPGDGVLYYHSSCAVPGVAGLAEVASPAYPDATQFDPKSPYYDPKATPAQPRWFAVDLKFKKQAKQVIPGALMRQTPGLESMLLFKLSRLSVSPVTPKEWKIITSLKSFW